MVRPGRRVRWGSSVLGRRWAWRASCPEERGGGGDVKTQSTGRPSFRPPWRSHPLVYAWPCWIAILLVSDHRFRPMACTGSSFISVSAAEAGCVRWFEQVWPLPPLWFGAMIVPSASVCGTGAAITRVVWIGRVRAALGGTYPSRGNAHQPARRKRRHFLLCLLH